MLMMLDRPTQPNPMVVTQPEFEPDNRFRNGWGKPVVALDIDGTLGDYHKHFLEFAQNWIGRPMPAPDTINPGRPLWQHMGVEQSVYRQCKLAYRQGGLKRWMPVYDGAADIAAKVRAKGAELWLCTTRPYLKLDNIDADTREWLKRNQIQYDAVIFGSDKYRELARQVGARRIVSVADDLPELCEQARAVGVHNVYLRDQPYNHLLNSVQRRALMRVHTLRNLQDLIVDDIARWSNSSV